MPAARLGRTLGRERAGTHRPSSAVWAWCRVALPRVREPLTPAPVPADLSDLGSRHQRAQGQWGLTFQPALPGTPVSSRWELGLEGHQAVIHTSLLLSSILLEGKVVCWLPAGPECPESLFLIRVCTFLSYAPECVHAARIGGWGGPDLISRGRLFSVRSQVSCALTQTQ